MLGVVLLGSLIAVISCNGQVPPGFGNIPGYVNDGFNRFNEFGRGFQNFRPVPNFRPTFTDSRRPSIPFVNPGNPLPIPSLNSLPNFVPNPSSLPQFPGSEAVSTISETVEEFPKVILNNVASSAKTFQQLPQAVSGGNPVKNLTTTVTSTTDDDAITNIVKTIIAATGENVSGVFSEAALRKAEEQFQNIIKTLVPANVPVGLNGLSLGPQTQTASVPVAVTNTNGQGSGEAAPSAVSSVSSSTSTSVVNAA